MPDCPPALAEGEKDNWGGRTGATGLCLPWDCGAEASVMGRKSLIREVWVLGSLPDKFAPPPPSLFPPLPPPPGGFQQLLLEPVLKFHYMLKKLQLHKEEYVLMQAISLFSPGEDPPVLPGLPPPHACSPPLSFSAAPISPSSARPREGPNQWP